MTVVLTTLDKRFIRKWRSKQSISHLSVALGVASNTIHGYCNHAGLYGPTSIKSVPRIVSKNFKYSNRKLTEEFVHKIFTEFKNLSNAQIAELGNTTKGNISMIRCFRTWGDVTKQYKEV